MESQFRRYGMKALCIGLLVIGLALAGVAFPASAHEHPNHGTIKVHDSEEVDPARQNQPHVSCQFWIEGFTMAEAEGTLVIYEWAPTGEKGKIVWETAWEADSGSDEEGYHFNYGPIGPLSPGHYRVEAFLEDGHPGEGGHFAKAKMFWVDECRDDSDVVVEPVECPPNVMATAESEGAITLQWDAVADADKYRIYRSVGDDEDFDAYMEVDAESLSFEDTDTEEGVTYRYYVTAVVDGVESEECEIVEATAIPFFPGAAGLAIGSVVAIGAYVAFRRRA